MNERTSITLSEAHLLTQQAGLGPSAVSLLAIQRAALASTVGSVGLMVIVPEGRYIVGYTRNGGWWYEKAS